ncbi:MAG: 4Fe-4S binding protein [Pseudomonadota bacterium]
MPNTAGTKKSVAKVAIPRPPITARPSGALCNLCGLCAAVCPVNLAPDEMFLEMRREAVDRGAAPLPAHQRILA